MVNGMEPRTMHITPDTTAAEILTEIESRCGTITPAIRELIEGFINDGLNPDFIWDAGIETVDQHLDDVRERITDAHATAKAEAKQGITMNTRTGKRTEGNAEAAAAIPSLAAALRIVTKATR